MDYETGRMLYPGCGRKHRIKPEEALREQTLSETDEKIIDITAVVHHDRDDRTMDHCPPEIRGNGDPLKTHASSPLSFSPKGRKPLYKA